MDKFEKLETLHADLLALCARVQLGDEKSPPKFYRLDPKPGHEDEFSAKADEFFNFIATDFPIPEEGTPEFNTLKQSLVSTNDRKDYADPSLPDAARAYYAVLSLIGHHRMSCIGKHPAFTNFAKHFIKVVKLTN